MSRPERLAEVRGARDIAELWRALPAAVLRYPAPTSGVDLGQLSDSLRTRAWRDHCTSPGPYSCAEQGRDCAAAAGGCRADALFPMSLGGGARSWRMATLYFQWWPSLGALHLIALGDTACAELGWAARLLRERHGLNNPEHLPVNSFGDLEPRGANRWRLRIVTPWVVSKGTPSTAAPPEAAAVTRELWKSLVARAHKFTALCAREPIWQRLGGHLVHHLADRLLPIELAVEQVGLEVITDATARSVSNGQGFTEVSWIGEVTLRAGPALWPWLGLLAVCGGGENADKGKGRVELWPLPHLES